MTTKKSRLKRSRRPMPDFMKRALTENALTRAYKARPAYQQNDYIWWITSPARDATREKRLDQMLAELKRGDVYMNMRWNAPERKTRRKK